MAASPTPVAPIRSLDEWVAENVELLQPDRVVWIDGSRAQLDGLLREMVDETLRKIDPTLAPARSTLAGPKGGQMTPEELQAMLRRAQEAAQKKAQDHE